MKSFIFSRSINTLSKLSGLYYNINLLEAHIIKQSQYVYCSIGSFIKTTEHKVF